MRRSSNDNAAPPRGERLIASTLANSAVVARHITDGLQTVLKESDVPREVRRAVKEFIAPALALLDRTDRDVIDYVRAPEVSPLAATRTAELFDEVITRLKGFAADFQGAARGDPSVAPLANGFSGFVNGLAKAWGLPMAKEIDEPDLER